MDSGWLTREDAIEIAEKRIWRRWNDAERARFQLFTDRLSMPFDVFHGAVEVVLKRAVFTHEFAGNAIKKEYISKFGEPTANELRTLLTDAKDFGV